MLTTGAGTFVLFLYTSVSGVTEAAVMVHTISLACMSLRQEDRRYQASLG